MTGNQPYTRLLASIRKRRTRRASFVCKVCQKRTILCDLSFRSPPCTKCRLDQTECSLPEYRRRRPNPDRPNAIAVPVTAGRSSNRLISSRSTHIERLEFDVCHFDTSLNCRGEVDGRSVSAYNTYDDLVPCFKPLPSNLDITDLSYLNKRGAFELPAPRLLSQLLSAYLQYAYGYMPIIDLQEVLGNFTGGSSTSVSWLLFQCILFAGVAFIDVFDLAAAGFNSRGEAHDHYFDKAQLLYDFDCEQEPLVLIQALAMMSLCNRRYRSHKDSLHWLESSISLAFKHGLHREELAKSGKIQNDGLRKRVWWSLYSQSRMMSLGMTHPLRSIDLEDSNVSSLSLDNFDFRHLPSPELDILHHCSIIRCVDEQKTLAKMFLLKISLCLSLESAEQLKCKSKMSAIIVHAPCFSHSASEARSEDLKLNAPTESLFEKWYLPTEAERSSLSASFLSLSPTDRAIRLYRLHLKLLREFSRLSAS